MERMDNWQKELKLQLDRITSQLRTFAGPPQLGGDVDFPSLEADMHKLSKGLDGIFHKIERSIRSIAELLSDLTTSLPDVKVPELVHALGDMVAVASVVLSQSGPSLHVMAQGETLQGVLGLTDETIQSLYKLTCYLYEQQHYEEASGCFFLLTLLNPSCYEFWLGLGNCEYLLGKYVEALLPYSMALEARQDDPLCHILNAKCHMALGNYPLARACLMMAEISPVALEDVEKVKRQKEAVYNELKRFL